MRRGLWFVAGAGTAVYVMVRGRRAAEAFTIDGLKDRLGALEVGARMVRQEIAQGQAEKESELREKLGLVPHGATELTAGRHKAVPPPRATPSAAPRATPRATPTEEGSN